MKPPPADFPSRDPEARLTALLLGELAPEEAAILRKEIASDPALRERHDQLAATVGLLREHFAPANGTVPTTLPTEQRERLLQSLGQPAASGEPPVLLPVHRTPWWQVAIPLGLAATVTFLLASVVFAPRFLKGIQMSAFAPDSGSAPTDQTESAYGIPEEKAPAPIARSADATVRGLAVLNQAEPPDRSTEGLSFGFPSTSTAPVNGPGAANSTTSPGAPPASSATLPGATGNSQPSPRSRERLAQAVPQVDFYYQHGEDNGRAAASAPTAAPSSGTVTGYDVGFTTRGEAVREDAETVEELNAAIPPPTGPTVGFIMDAKSSQPRGGSEIKSDRTPTRGYAGRRGGLGGGVGFGGAPGGGESAFGGFGGGGFGVAGTANRDFASGLAGETAQAETGAATEWAMPRTAVEKDAFGRAPDAAGAPVVGEALTELARKSQGSATGSDGNVALFEHSGNGVFQNALGPQGGRGADVAPLDDGIVASGGVAANGAIVEDRLGRQSTPPPPAAPSQPRPEPAPVELAARPTAPPTARFVPPPAPAKPKPAAAPGEPSTAPEGSAAAARFGLLAGKAPQAAGRPEVEARKAKPAPRMDRLMAERYAILPADEAADQSGLTASGLESSKAALLDTTLDVAEAPALTAADGRTRGRAQTRRSGQNRAWYKGTAPTTTTATAAPGGEPQPMAGEQAGAYAHFADASRAPTLGDLPQVGQMFRASPGQAGGGTSAVTANTEEEELAPLPLKLPVPAFRGTPLDMNLGSARSPAPQRETRSRALTPEVPSTQARKQSTVFAGTTVQELGEPTATKRDAPANKAPSEPRAANELAKAEAVDKLAAAAGARKRLSEGKANLALRKRLSSSVETEARQLKEAEKQLEQQQLALVEGREELRRKNVAAKRAKAEAAKLQDLARKVPAPPPAEPLPEVLTGENPFSTFSLNVADVSFKLAAAALAQGRMPEAGRIRSEEFVNALDYRDPAPAPGQRVGFVWERARFPFAHNREVLRFSLKTAALGREANRPLNLVLLLDSSGSMERADRVRIVRNALDVLGQQLRPNDRLSVVTFSSQPNLRADGVQGKAARQALRRATEIPPEGGTNLEEAMKLAYATAGRHFLANGINRVVVLTDGAANLGDVSPERLQKLVEANRQKGIAFDAFGVGWEGYNDDLLEVLTRHGDGRYGFMNTPEEAATGFAQQLAGALQVAAADVKVQVEFNPSRILRYRQVGFRQHRLTKEQFRDNTVDAAEIGAAEAGNALYIIETKPDGQGPIGHLRARYRVPATGAYEEQEWLLDYRGPAISLASAPATLRLATTAATFAEWLAGSPYAAGVKLDELLKLIRDVPAQYPRDPRPGQLRQMIEQARSIQGL